MIKNISLSKLVIDDELYPRQNLNEVHIRSMIRTLEGEQELPPIVVWKQQSALIIVDGWHRFQAYTRTKANTIKADLRKYTNKREAFQAAISLNSAHGLRLDDNDAQRVIEIGETLGLKEVDLATALRTSISHLRSLKNRFATISEAHKGVKALRRVALKNSVRHLSGTQITVEQEKAMESAPGQSYLLTIDQLISAVRYKLLPPRDKHEALWERLSELHTLLGKLLK